ncbi:MAG TPA: hypothetical protein VLB01_04840 [Thermodesulfobacteriota bacterium]|nr:hypothetical protein [Thermodesulfobacteriota bacterium]
MYPKPLIKGLPVHGWPGIALVVTFWMLNWLLPGPRTHWGFFPLWLGYCLTVDALVFSRKGSSMLTRGPGGYAILFLVSIPAWWLFELLNKYTRNWHYIGGEFLTDLEYAVLASLSFSTVIPAVFGTAELVSTFKWIKQIKRGPVVKPTPLTLLVFFITGWLMLILLLAYPTYFFPFLWLSVYFILEPLNVLLKNRSLFEYTTSGDWRPVLALWLGCLICGFFWEMWNFFSYPKWIYDVPFVNFLNIFEMPLLGYGGYLPFALELFALYHLIIGIFGQKDTKDFIQISPDEN